jgi:hypothetical protein
MLRTSFTVLQSKRRRELLLALIDRPYVDVDRVVSSAGDDRSRERTRQRLYHTHLPQLTDAELIEWDSDAGTVARGPRFDEFRPLLETLDENADRYAWDWP